MLAPDVKVSGGEPLAKQFLLVDSNLSFHSHQVGFRVIVARVASIIDKFVAVLVYHYVQNAKIVLGRFAQSLGLQALAPIGSLKWLSKSSYVRLDFANTLVVPTAATLLPSGWVDGRVDGQLVNVNLVASESVLTDLDGLVVFCGVSLDICIFGIIL